MPLKAIDYKKSIIYTIKTGDSVYIGSTCNFTTRKGHHKRSIYNQNGKQYNYKLYKTIRNNDWNWDMKPYKEYPCENRTQLIIEEERLRKELNADLNMMCCGTGLSKEDYKKQYRIENKDKNIEYQKHYKFQNKDKLLEQRKQKITCECGCVVSRSHLTRHKTSNKHIKRMEKK